MEPNNNDGDELSSKDLEYFGQCLTLAEKAYELQEVPVGCVLVFGDSVIGRGHNDVNRTKNPTRHAEMVAIEEAENWCRDNCLDFEEVVREMVLYVTLEPCIMCSAALYKLKLKKMIFGASNPRFGGVISVAGNHNYGYEHEIEIVKGIAETDCVQLLKKFYGRENPFAPEEKKKVKNKT